MSQQEEMMQDELNEAFWTRTDAVIQLANTQAAADADDVNALIAVCGGALLVPYRRPSRGSCQPAAWS